LLHATRNFDTLVLPDVKEKGSSLTNSLESPALLFICSQNIRTGSKKSTPSAILPTYSGFEVLKITLLGPTRRELEIWGTETEIKEEWLAASQKLALKDSYS
jgi:hypothetical protein